MRSTYSIDPKINAAAMEALKAQGFSLADYIRHALAHVAEGNPVPFARRDFGFREGRPKGWKPKPKAPEQDAT